MSVDYHNMSQPLRWSVFIHIAIIVAVVVGLPDWRARLKVIEPTEIIVDLVTIDDITAAPNTSQAPKNKEKQPQPKPKEAKPKVKKTEEAKPKEKPKPKAAPKSEGADDLKTPPDIKPKPPQEKPKEKPKAVTATPDAEAEDTTEVEEKTQEVQQDQFTSVLKNLVDQTEEQEEVEPEQPSVDAPVDMSKPSGRAPNQSDVVTATEIDVLKQQLARCWNIPIGARDAEDLYVDIDVTVGRNRMVQSARIVNIYRYQTDSFFRTAAESARRALLSPDCSPLALPSEKYHLWKDIRIRFNPKEMFGG